MTTKPPPATQKLPLSYPAISLSFKFRVLSLLVFRSFLFLVFFYLTYLPYACCFIYIGLVFIHLFIYFILLFALCVFFYMGLVLLLLLFYYFYYYYYYYYLFFWCLVLSALSIFFYYY